MAKLSKEVRTTKSHWSTLSEEDLLRTTFTTSDPESLDGLVEDVPAATSEPPYVEYWYDFRGSKRERIRCVHCRYHNHLAGYVLKTAQGSRFLVGHDCGDKLYGAAFEALRSDYDDAREYASNLRRWRHLLAALPEFLEWLSSLQKCAAVRTFRDTKRDFRAELPRLFGAIAVALYKDKGVLSAEEKLRDFAAEERAEERFEREKEAWEKLTATERKNRRRYDGEKAPQPPSLPIFKHTSKPVMTVRAAKFFSEHQLPHEDLASVQSAFQTLAQEINGATLKAAAYEGRKDDWQRERRHLFASTFKGVFGRTSALLDSIRSIVDDVGEMAAFFSLESLSTVVPWANQHPKIKEQFVLRGRGVALVPAGKIVALPADFSVPSLDSIERFVQAINAS